MKERITERDWHTAKIKDATRSLDENYERAKLKKLWELENGLEDGTTFKFPCKIDTFVYAIDKFTDRIIYGQLVNIAIDRYCTTYTVLDIEHYQYYACRIVSFTRPEAEKKLTEE